MTTTEAILERLKSLPDSAQQEVLDFVRFLESRREELIQRDEDAAWSHFSLASAMRDMEDEVYPRRPQGILPMIQEGQIVLFTFPQTDQIAGKLRPALVLRSLPGSRNDWLICMVSTQLYQEVPELDEVVRETDPDFLLTGLKTTSLIRVTRIAVVSADLLHGAVGNLAVDRLERIRSRLGRWISGNADVRLTV